MREVCCRLLARGATLEEGPAGELMCMSKKGVVEMLFSTSYFSIKKSRASSSNLGRIGRGRLPLGGCPLPSGDASWSKLLVSGESLPTDDMYRQVSKFRDLQLCVGFEEHYFAEGQDSVSKRINQKYLNPIEPLPDR